MPPIRRDERSRIEHVSSAGVGLAEEDRDYALAPAPVDAAGDDEREPHEVRLLAMAAA